MARKILSDRNFSTETEALSAEDNLIILHLSLNLIKPNSYSTMNK